MRSNFFKVIFFFLFFPSLSFCQSWPSYSDSVYTLIKKNDWKSAYQLTHKVDSLLSVEGYSNDTIYADYLYRRGILKNAIQEDYSDALNDLLLSESIWQNSNFYNPKKYHFICFWIAKTYNTNLLIQRKVDSASGIVDIEKSNLYFLKSIEINLNHDTININTLSESYDQISYSSFLNYEDDILRKYALLAIKSYNLIKQPYIKARKYDLYRRLSLAFNDVSEENAYFHFQAARYLAEIGGANEKYFFDLIGECGLMYRKLTNFDDYGKNRSMQVMDFADSVCDHSNFRYYSTVLFGKKVSSLNDSLALGYAFKQLDWLKKYEGDSSVKTIEHYAEIAFRYSLMDNSVKRVEFLNLALKEAEKYGGVADTILAEWHNDLAVEYSQYNDNIKGDYHFNKYLELRKNYKNDEYLKLRVRYYTEKKLFDTAFMFLSNNESSFKSKENLLISYMYLLDMDISGYISIEKTEIILDRFENLVNSVNDTSLSYMKLMLHYYKQDWDAVISFIETQKDYEEFDFWQMIFFAYVNTGRTDEALEFLDKMIAEAKSLNKGPGLLSFYRQPPRLSTLSSDVMKYITPAKNLISKYNLQGTDIEAEFMAHEGSVLLNNGNFTKGITLLKKSKEIFETYELLTDFRTYLEVLISLSRSEENPIKLLELFDEAEKVILKYCNQSSFCEKDILLARVYAQKGMTFSRLHTQGKKTGFAVEDIITFLEQSKEYYYKLDFQNNPTVRRNLSLTHSTLASICNSKNCFEENLKKAYELGEDYSVFGTLVPFFITEAKINRDAILADSSMQLIKKATNYFEKEVNSRFIYLSDLEKQQFLKDNNINMLYYSIDNFLYFLSEDDPIFFKNRNSYNNYLKEIINDRIFFRSLLFANSNQKLLSKAISSKDTSLLQLVSQIRFENNYLNKIIEKGSSKDLISKQQDKINNLEKTLSFSINSDESEYSLNSLKNSLSKNEVFVEIVRINQLDTAENSTRNFNDNISYAAIVIKANEEPRLVMLDQENVFENSIFNHYATYTKRDNGKIDKISYSYYLDKLFDEIDENNIIYFSPDGIYNNINIQTLFNVEKNQYLLEYIDVRLVSGARMFIDGKAKTEKEYDSNVAVLFGNPSFNLQNISEVKDFDDVFAVRDFDINSFEELKRSGISPLPGTLKEIENIKNLLQKYDWDVDFKQGADASEYFLKQVSSPRVLHIATHGYFHDSKNDSERDNLNFLTNNLTNFDNPLLRSGVLLSGSENTIKGEVFSQENGILNALEAKNLDLVNTELVVLSACETGLGEYVSGEGVYGLQRSILEAGSDNVIMSLWKVDDQATQLLINTFYSNWLEQGMSKREALRQAQLYMLNTDKYKSPFYWGAFVLIEK